MLSLTSRGLVGINKFSVYNKIERQCNEDVHRIRALYLQHNSPLSNFGQATQNPGTQNHVHISSIKSIRNQKDLSPEYNYSYFDSLPNKPTQDYISGKETTRFNSFLRPCSSKHELSTPRRSSSENPSFDPLEELLTHRKIRSEPDFIESVKGQKLLAKNKAVKDLSTQNEPAHWEISTAVKSRRFDKDKVVDNFDKVMKAILSIKPSFKIPYDFKSWKQSPSFFSKPSQDVSSLESPRPSPSQSEISPPPCTFSSRQSPQPSPPRQEISPPPSVFSTVNIFGPSGPQTTSQQILNKPCVRKEEAPLKSKFKKSSHKPWIDLDTASNQSPSLSIPRQCPPKPPDSSPNVIYPPIYSYPQTIAHFPECSSCPPGCQSPCPPGYQSPGPPGCLPPCPPECLPSCPSSLCASACPPPCPCPSPTQCSSPASLSYPPKKCPTPTCPRPCPYPCPPCYPPAEPPCKPPIPDPPCLAPWPLSPPNLPTAPPCPSLIPPHMPLCPPPPAPPTTPYCPNPCPTPCPSDKPPCPPPCKCSTEPPKSPPPSPPQCVPPKPPPCPKIRPACPPPCVHQPQCKKCPPKPPLCKPKSPTSPPNELRKCKFHTFSPKYFSSKPTLPGDILTSNNSFCLSMFSTTMCTPSKGPKTSPPCSPECPKVTIKCQPQPPLPKHPQCPRGPAIYTQVFYSPCPIPPNPPYLPMRPPPEPCPPYRPPYPPYCSTPYPSPWVQYTAEPPCVRRCPRVRKGPRCWVGCPMRPPPYTLCKPKPRFPRIERKEDKCPELCLPQHPLCSYGEPRPDPCLSGYLRPPPPLCQPKDIYSPIIRRLSLSASVSSSCSQSLLLKKLPCTKKRQDYLKQNSLLSSTSCSRFTKVSSKQEQKIPSSPPLDDSTLSSKETSVFKNVGPRPIFIKEIKENRTHVNVVNVTHSCAQIESIYPCKPLKTESESPTKFDPWQSLPTEVVEKLNADKNFNPITLFCPNSEKTRCKPMSDPIKIPPNPCVPRFHHGNFYRYQCLFYYVCFPIIIVLSIKILILDSHHIQPQCIEYEYMRRRTKKYPWYDGYKTLFHNDRVNNPTRPGFCPPPYKEKKRKPCKQPPLEVVCPGGTRPAKMRPGKRGCPKKRELCPEFDKKKLKFPLQAKKQE